jgi:hypothetical protein
VVTARLSLAGSLLLAVFRPDLVSAGRACGLGRILPPDLLACPVAGSRLGRQ